jgi:mevalonate kinase
VQSYFSHGKVLLCGEYAVLAGVEALALPVHLGQGLKVWEVPTEGNSKIIWESTDENGKSWFDCRIDSDDAIAKTLIHLFREIKSKNPTYFDHKTIRMETNVEFNRTWGLGTSSTLVSLLNRWSGTNAFALQESGFGGSGYDVAIGLTGKPLVFWLENEEPN